MSRTGSRARQDLIIVALFTGGFALLSVRLDLSESLLRWAHAREGMQLDEFPQILLVLAGLLSWFAWRRMHELRAELARRRAAEAQLAAALAENRRLGSHALELQESERRALAREMHDELGQYLVAIRLDASALRDASGAGAPRSLEIAAAIVSHVDHVQSVVRDIIGRLRPAGLEVLGLAAALESSMEDWRRRLPGIEIRLSMLGELDALGADVSLALYRLTQESLVNVSRHASAGQVQIALRQTNEADGMLRVELCVQDDGRGAVLPPNGRGVGLVGMRERMLSLGGTFDVDSQPGAGFRIRATIRCRPGQATAGGKSDAA